MESYPYYIMPMSRYHLEMIPIESIEERVNFFYKYKRNNEHLYKGIIDKSNLEFDDRQVAFKQFKRYFKENHYTLGATHRDHLSKKLFPKMCWLTESFFNRGFVDPVCVHYNPRIQKNVMHPGTTRNWVMGLFQHTSSINCLYFNTGGVQLPFMKNLKVVEKEELESIKTLFINLAADHGSLIPHININETSVENNIPIWQDFIVKRLADPSFRISMNTTIDFLSQWEVEPALSYIHIVIADPTNIDDVCRACILSVIGQSYSSPTLTVTCKDKVLGKPEC